MVTEKQVAAILVLVGAGTAFAFAIFNCYLSFRPNSITLLKSNEPIKA